MSDQTLQILVVEDNEDFLQTLCDMLAALGHSPRGVASGEAALDLLGEQAYDILIADIDLPGISGIELAKSAYGRAPHTRIVFSSGFGYLLTDKLEFDFAVLHKPYFLHQLVDAIGLRHEGTASAA